MAIESTPSSNHKDKPVAHSPQRPQPPQEEGVFHIKLLSLDEMLRHMPTRPREEIVRAWKINREFVNRLNLDIIKARLKKRGENFNDPEITRQLKDAGFDLSDTKAS